MHPAFHSSYVEAHKDHIWSEVDSNGRAPKNQVKGFEFKTQNHQNFNNVNNIKEQKYKGRGLNKNC